MSALVLLFALHIQCFNLRAAPLPGGPIVTVCFYDAQPISTTITAPCGSLCDVAVPERPKVRI